MKKLDSRDAENWMQELKEIAKKSTCKRSKCGAIIVKDNKIIGRGYNSPPKDIESQRRCNEDKTKLHRKVTDKTCCVHAEQRAIMNALKENPGKLNQASLLFIRLNDKGEIEPSSKPYCTICSKMALDVGIKEFILLHKECPISYDTEEYNLLSYQYTE